MIHSLLGALPELIDGEPVMNAPTYATAESVNGDAPLPVSEDQQPDGDVCVLDDLGDLHQGNDSHQRTDAPLARTHGAHSVMLGARESTDTDNGARTGIPADAEHDVHSPNVDANLTSDLNTTITACSSASPGTETNDSDGMDAEENEISTLHRRTDVGKSNTFTTSVLRLSTVSLGPRSSSNDSGPTDRSPQKDPLLAAPPTHQPVTTSQSPRSASYVDHDVSPVLPSCNPTEAKNLLPTSNKSVLQHSPPPHRGKQLHRNKAPPLSLPYLLRQADALLTTYPPSHPALRVREIMGKDSVVQTWHAPMITNTRDTSVDEWESDDYLQSLVNSENIVVPTPPSSPVLRPRFPKYASTSRWNGKGVLGLRQVGLRMGLLTPLERRLLLAGVLLVIGVAVVLKYNKLPKCLESWMLWQNQRRLASSISTFWGRAPWS